MSPLNVYFGILSSLRKVTDMETGERTAPSHRIAWLSLLASAVLLAVKFVAYQLTDSAAVLSDALESIVNVIASGFALFSITLSARPPDASHRNASKVTLCL